MTTDVYTLVRQLRAEFFTLRETRDALVRAMEIIAVGDAENPQAQAVEELIALGFWRDIPETRELTATHPVKRLTDEQIRKLGNSLPIEHRFHSRAFARAIETACATAWGISLKEET